MRTLFRLIKQALFKQGVRPLLIVLQMFIGFTALTMGLGIINYSQEFVTDVQKIEAPDTIEYISTQQGTSISNEQLQKLERSLQNHPDVQSVGTYLTVDKVIPELVDIPVVKNKTPLPTAQLMQKPQVTIVYLDRGFLDLHPVAVTTGRSLKNSDVKEGAEDQFPVLIGSKLAESVSLGSVLTGAVFDSQKLNDKPKKMIVVGVLPKNFAFWRGGGGLIETSYQQDDTMILAPMQPEQQTGEDFKTRLGNNLQVQLKPGADQKSFRGYLDQKMNGVGLKGHVTTMAENIENYQKSHRQQVLFILAFASLLLLLSSFGLLGIILTSVVRRQREFGIRFALGATPLSLAATVIGEVLVLISLSAMLGIVSAELLVNLSPDNTPIAVGWFSIVITLCVIVLVALVGTAIPMLRIVRMNPVKLIRGGL